MGNVNPPYVDVYDIAELQMSDNNAVYYCKATISEHVYAEDNVTIGNLTLGKYLASWCKSNNYDYVCVFMIHFTS